MFASRQEDETAWQEPADLPMKHYDIKKVTELIYSTCAIDMIEMRLGDDGLKKLIPLMKESTVLHKLQLCGNFLTDASVPLLIEACAANKSIRDLRLQWNHISYKGIKQICSFITKDNGIQSLELHGNTLIGAKGAYLLANAILEAPTLTYLGLAGCDLKDEGVLALAAAVRSGKNRTLKQIHVSHNHCEDEDIHELKSLSFSNAGQWPDSIVEKLPAIGYIQEKVIEINAEIDLLQQPKRNNRRSWRLSLRGLELQPTNSSTGDESNLFDTIVSQTNDTEHSTQNKRRSRLSIKALFKGNSGTDHGTNHSAEDFDKVAQENKELKQKLETLQFMYDNLQRQHESLKEEFESFKNQQAS